MPLKYVQRKANFSTSKSQGFLKKTGQLLILPLFGMINEIYVTFMA